LKKTTKPAPLKVEYSLWKPNIPIVSRITLWFSDSTRTLTSML